jgi:hypothetical protein
MVNSLNIAMFAGLIGLASQAAIPAQAGVLAQGTMRSAVGAAQSSDMPVQQVASGPRCTPEAALQKAKRIGIRKATLVYVRFNSIGVTGQLNGNRIDVKFSRDTNCPVLHLD